MKIIRYIKEMARIAHFMRGYASALRDAKDKGIWICPCCHEWMANPPQDFHICPHCNVEFGYDAPESRAGSIFASPRLDGTGAKTAVDSHNQDLPWSRETMIIINDLTPLIEDKAFDPNWFLLRNRLEEFERTMLGMSHDNK